MYSVTVCVGGVRRVYSVTVCVGGACSQSLRLSSLPTPAISPTPPPPPDPASVSGAAAVRVGPLLAGGEAGDGAGEGEEAARHDVEELAVDVAAAAGQCQLEARLRI